MIKEINSNYYNKIFRQIFTEIETCCYDELHQQFHDADALKCWKAVVEKRFGNSVAERLQELEGL